MVTLAKDHMSVVCQHFQRVLYVITGPVCIKFHLQPPRKQEKKVYIFFHPGHMTKMAACPHMVKIFKKCSSSEPIH